MNKFDVILKLTIQKIFNFKKWRELNCMAENFSDILK